MYPATLLPPAIACLALAVLFRPWAAFDDIAALDRWLFVTCGAVVFQLIPMPGVVVDFLAPHDRAVWRALALAPPSALPFSINPGAGLWAAGVVAGLVTIFVSARRVFTVAGVRRVTRAVATIGVILAGIALAQDASGGGRMYWRWRPLEEGAPPFGPFVNRNHFATWVILAVPLVLGYLVAHVSAHHHRSIGRVSWRRRFARSFDGRSIWLMAAVAIMILALAVSLSRSGLFGLAVALLAGVLLAPMAGSPTHAARWVLGGFAIAFIAVIARVDPETLVSRVAAAPVSAAGRLTIWRDTIPVIRDFWLTGTGAGTYETAMLVYQRASPGVRFNQAHNEYLQLAAEGGLLLCLPIAIAVGHFVRQVSRRLHSDTSGMYWIRAGAVCGLLGVAAQSIWETGLMTPANAVLAAVVAAIALHTPAVGRQE